MKVLCENQLQHCFDQELQLFRKGMIYKYGLKMLLVLKGCPCWQYRQEKSLSLKTTLQLP